ncbi:MAG: adenine deaminase [Theionarchaea archaeon]|nr:adenine deaminase [Theionarchaea archaeon]
MKLKGNLVNLFTEDIYPVELSFDTAIRSIHHISQEQSTFLLPGFIDAHIHVESSLLCPSRFAEAVVPHGTTCTISDPHEIANVLGVEGIRYMIEDTQVLKIYYTAPSCVPATPFETSGALLPAETIGALFDRYPLIGLGEVMNVPGVISSDPDLIEKISIARRHGKPIDGHAPGLTGISLQQYISKGISTDHECTTLEEAREKLELGMHILIREGTASKNFKDLMGLNYDRCFLVSDDLHAEDMERGHMDVLLQQAVSSGIDPITAIKMVTLNPADHYHLDTGILTPGRPADIVVATDLHHFEVMDVFIDGAHVAHRGIPLFSAHPIPFRSPFLVNKKNPEDFAIACHEKERVKVRVIGIVEGQLFTRSDTATLVCEDGRILPDVEQDVLKLAVVDRYGQNHVGKGFARGFGMQKGALASSVSHDSHNIIAVGTSDDLMAQAVNTLIDMKGGIAACGEKTIVLGLPVAGLMSEKDVHAVARSHRKVQDYARELGCVIQNPFMQLSFLALLVIPELKLSDRGLFDSTAFQFVDVIT